jgi:hypothetical protein
VHAAGAYVKDFAVILRGESGQTFGVSGEYILQHEKPTEGSLNRYLFALPDGQTLEVIIVEHRKATAAVLLGHYLEVLKAYIRRLGMSLARI